MNKENKREAMERRAQERQKLEKKNRVYRSLQNWGPVVLIVAVVVGLLIAIITSGTGSDGIAAGDDSEMDFAFVDEDGNELEITDWTEIGEEEVEDLGELDTTGGAVVADGDVVNIDYEGRHNGELFEGGTADGEDVTIGAGEYIEGFEEGIVGHAVGETFDMPVTFPEGYGDELAGEEVVFTVTVNGIYKK